MKYMVIENRVSFSVVLDEDGRFINVVNMRYSVGQTVDYVIPINNKHMFTKKINFAFSGVAVCLLFSMIFYYQYITNSIYGSVYFSVNPEVKMEIKKNGEIKNLLPLNEDGKLIIQNIDAKGKSIVQVSKTLIDNSITLDKLTDSDKINLAIESPNDEKWFQKIEFDLQENLTSYVYKKNMNIIVNVFKFEENPAIPSDTIVKPTPTNTPKPTNNSIETNTPKPTNNSIETNTPKPTNNSIETNTPKPTNNSIETNTPKPTNNSIETNTPKPTNNSIETNTPKPTNNSIETNTPKPTNNSIETQKIEATIKPDDTPVKTIEPTVQPTQTPQAEFVPTASPSQEYYDSDDDDDDYNNNEDDDDNYNDTNNNDDNDDDDTNDNDD